jgi:uncharacterized membrane protein (DUF485 family)
MNRKITKEELLQDPDFRHLVAQRNFISWTLTLLELILYFGFIGLIAFNKPFLGIKLIGSITVGIPIAVGTIILSWAFTGVYIWWANNEYDDMVDKIKDKLEV